jgi:hypothetical protein
MIDKRFPFFLQYSKKIYRLLDNIFGLVYNMSCNLGEIIMTHASKYYGLLVSVCGFFVVCDVDGADWFGKPKKSSTETAVSKSVDKFTAPLLSYIYQGSSPGAVLRLLTSMSKCPNGDVVSLVFDSLFDAAKNGNAAVFSNVMNVMFMVFNLCLTNDNLPIAEVIWDWLVAVDARNPEVLNDVDKCRAFADIVDKMGKRLNLVPAATEKIKEVLENTVLSPDEKELLAYYTSL